MDKTLSNRGRTRDKKEKSFFVSVFTSTLIALAVGLLLLLASCFLGLSLDDPDKFSHKKSGLVCGALSGVLLVGILVLLAFAFGLGIRISLFAICAPAAIVVASLAGLCGVGAGSVKKPKHKVKF